MGLVVAVAIRNFARKARSEVMMDKTETCFKSDRRK